MKTRTEPQHPAKKAYGVSETNAKAIGEIVATWASVIGVDPEEFTIYPPGFHASGWTIAAEIGVDDWPFYFSEWLMVTPKYKNLVSRFLLEPVNHWCLGIYT